MKIAILWPQMSGYFGACLRALIDDYQVDVFLSFQDIHVEDAPFRLEIDIDPKKQYRFKEAPNFTDLIRHIEEFNPDVILVCSWNIKQYREISLFYRNKVRRIMFMDNPWHGSLKQRVASLCLKNQIRSLCDFVFVPGERQVDFAKRLGFSISQICTGGYSGDWKCFAAVHESRTALAPGFIFVGRLIEQKGISVLIEAYNRYCDTVDVPLPLHVCGVGVLSEVVDRWRNNNKNVIWHGFVQPEDIPDIFYQCSCLILPSILEHWGVVVHEACSAGLSVICSDSCGSQVDLVKGFHNGFVYSKKDNDGLLGCLIKYHSLSSEDKVVFSRNSHLMSKRFTPHEWARSLVMLGKI